MFFIPVGIMLLVFGIVMFVINKNNQNYIQTEAIVPNVQVLEDEHYDAEGNIVEASYRIDVKYNVDDKEYSSSLDNVSRYSIGDKITIYYNPKDPRQITQIKSLVLPIVIITIGVISLVFGIIGCLLRIKNKNV